MSADPFELHERSLLDSWRLLASVDPQGRVADDGAAAIMTHSHPALCNALLRSPSGLARIRHEFGSRHHAVWLRGTAEGPLAEVLAAAGYRPDERTVPMVLELARWSPEDSSVPIRQVPPGDVAERSGVDRSVLADVPRTFAHAADGWESWAITMTTRDAVNVSFVTTLDQYQRRGLARAVVTRALLDARERGETYATLQSTEAGLALYRRLGFVEIGSWQEWVPG